MVLLSPETLLQLQRDLFNSHPIYPRLYHLGLGLHWLRWLGHGAEIGVANNTIMATHLVVAQDV